MNTNVVGALSEARDLLLGGFFAFESDAGESTTPEKDDTNKSISSVWGSDDIVSNLRDQQENQGKKRKGES